MGILTRNEIISEIYKILGIAFLLVSCAFLAPTLYKTTRPSLPIFYYSFNIFELTFVYDYTRYIGSYFVWGLMCYIMFRVSFTFLISGWKISKMKKNLETRFDLNIIGGILSAFTMIYTLLLLLRFIPPIYFFPAISLKLAPSIEAIGDFDKSIFLNTLYFWVMLEIIRLVSARIIKLGIKELVIINDVPEPNLIKSILRRLKISSILRRLRIK
ncbi:MAG: hypothetical protein HWN67_15675 [Candidatus Helarchaeota archaeon]|nr:hypothetical protein [Candidatus Helarchaeota archaeon]